ncbi:MAG: uroporphyrinogen-III synthase [Chloroflexota bacterium]
MNGLAGKRILVTRPQDQASALIEKLNVYGAESIAFPTIKIASLDDPAPLFQAIVELRSYRWVIFTSVNGVSEFWKYLTACGQNEEAFVGIDVAAIGPATAEALRERGVEPRFMPDEYIADAIAAGLGDVQGERILLLRADIARKSLKEELEKRSAIPNEVAVYHIQSADFSQDVLMEFERGIDIITFTSASTVRNFMKLMENQSFPSLSQAVIACIGPITADAARECGLDVHVIAAAYTTDGLVQALVDYFNPTP